MARKKKHEDHLNHEAWAIPYGDLITLLLAFFVVMYAISSVNEGKYRVLSDSMVAAFRGTPMTLEPVQVGEKQVGSGADVKTNITQSIVEGQPRSLMTAVPIKPPIAQRPLSEVEQQRQAEISHQQASAAHALTKVAEEVERAMDNLVKADMVIVRRKDFWIEVEIRTDILFPSASAQLQPSALGVIERLGNALAPFPNAIRVEGHTDNRPIKTVTFISNWELSAARAGSVVRVLASRGIAPSRLAVIGYGEYRPSHTNSTVEGRNANRRVIIVILSTDMAGQPGAPDPAVDLAVPGEEAVPPQPNPASTSTSTKLTPTLAAQPVDVGTGTVPAP
jgi:chemotaxis protein MotB